VSANILQTEEILPHNPAITFTNICHKFQQRSWSRPIAESCESLG